jgi:hypothetical protein
MTLGREMVIVYRYSSIRKNRQCFIFEQFLESSFLLQFNSIRVYLRANLTAQRPITKLARVHRNIKKQLKEQDTKYDSLYKGNKTFKNSTKPCRSEISELPHPVRVCPLLKYICLHVLQVLQA